MKNENERENRRMNNVKSKTTTTKMLPSLSMMIKSIDFRFDHIIHMMMMMMIDIKCIRCRHCCCGC